MVALVGDSKTVEVTSPLGSVIVVVTGPEVLSLEVSVTARPPTASRAAAAAAPNSSGGRLYQGSGGGSVAACSSV